MTPAERLLDAVSCARRHHDAVGDAVTVLRHTGHADLAERLETTWAEFGADGPDVEVYALPPEPGIGTVVRILSGPYEGEQLTRVDREASAEEYRWRRGRGSCWRWDEVVRWGARVVEGGGR